MKKPNLIEKAFLLKKTFLFQDMSLDNLLAVADTLDSFDQDKGTQILKAGAYPHYMFILVSGTVHLLNDQNEVIDELTDGAVFGHTALFAEQNYRFDAKCVKNSHLLAITKKHFSAIIGECPQVAIRLLGHFSNRLDQLETKKIPPSEALEG